MLWLDACIVDDPNSLFAKLHEIASMPITPAIPHRSIWEEKENEQMKKTKEEELRALARRARRVYK
jgi:hypothetical protein